jgi:hypothetical protein
MRAFDPPSIWRRPNSTSLPAERVIGAKFGQRGLTRFVASVAGRKHTHETGPVDQRNPRDRWACSTIWGEGRDTDPFGPYGWHPMERGGMSDVQSASGNFSQPSTASAHRGEHLLRLLGTRLLRRQGTRNGSMSNSFVAEEWFLNHRRATPLNPGHVTDSLSATESIFDKLPSIRRSPPRHLPNWRLRPLRDHTVSDRQKMVQRPFPRCFLPWQQVYARRRSSRCDSIPL